MTLTAPGNTLAPTSPKLLTVYIGQMLKSLASTLNHFTRPTAFDRLASQAHNLGFASTQSHQDFA